MMQLYYLPGACSLAAHVALEWTAAPYEAVAMTSDTLRAPEYLALNPGATVPLLRDGGFLLTESIAVLFYLAECFPELALLGVTPRTRAETMRWLAFMNSDLHAAFKSVFALKQLEEDDAHAARRISPATRRVRGHLERLDRQLAGRDWLTGVRSIADPYLFVMFRWAVGADIALDGLRHLTAFARRMYLDPGVRAALFAEEGLSL